MSGNAVRLQAINNVEAYVPPAISFVAGETPGKIFGSSVFTKSEMQARLPKSVYKSVVATIEKGAKLDPAVADSVAAAMKDWALEKGATHYAHVFYPMTGLTAEKHDSFLEPLSDGQTLAAASRSTTVKLYDVAAGRERRTDAVLRHARDVYTITYSPDGRLLASAGEDSAAMLWDVESGRERATFKGHAGYVRAVAVRFRKAARVGLGTLVRLCSLSGSCSNSCLRRAI